MNSISISIDAADPIIHDHFRSVKGAHAAALRGLKLLLANGVHPGVIMSVYRRNLHQIEPLLSLCRKFSVRYLKLNLVTPTGRGEQLEKAGLLLSPMEVKEEIIDKIPFWETTFDVPVVCNYTTPLISPGFICAHCLCIISQQI